MKIRFVLYVAAAAILVTAAGVLAEAKSAQSLGVFLGQMTANGSATSAR